MTGLLAWTLGMLALTAIGLFLARRWLDKQDKPPDKYGPP